MTSPIDFAKLRQEERRRARQKKKNHHHQRQEQQPTEELREGEQTTKEESERAPTASLLDAQRIIPEALVPAIDFQGLRQQERSQHLSQQTREISAAAGEKGRDWNFDHCSLDDVTYELTRLDPSIHLLSLSDQDPQFVYYISNCLSSTYQDQLSQWLLTHLPVNPVVSSSDPVQSNGKWTPLKYAGRRVAMFDSRIQPFPEPLQSLAQHLSNNVFGAPWMKLLNDNTEGKEDITTTINHILVNDYGTPAMGIMPHTDGPAYQPCTATMSLGSGTEFHFVPQRQQQQQQQQQEGGPKDQRFQMWLEPGSLVVFCQEAYSGWLHSIPPASEQRQRQPHESTTDESKQRQQPPLPQSDARRLSLTFRVAR